MSVHGNLAFPLDMAKGDPAATRERVVEMARALGIDSMLDRRPATQQLYGDPATAFVAAFLSSPQINLLQASARAVQGEGLELYLGPTDCACPGRIGGRPH
ncbi:MAG: sugar transporter ATP-binding protein [Actinomycetia bacterium]|nr:sugar transporter ATP-binding protein [Actinomycetes bacterium]